ncbi:MAG: sigma-70 family RNA polymerase sigma factor [Planctomycetota bacterium]
MVGRRKEAFRRAVPAPTGEPTLRPAPEPSPLADLDTQLMLRVREGDREAANALIRRNGERITRYISRLVRDPRAAEDLAQDVFVQALSRPERYEPTARVLTWLYRVATNLAMNYLKQPAVRRRASTAPDQSLNVPDRSQPAPDGRLSLTELRRQVSEAIGRLPVNQRIALTLCEYEECSYEQIAAVLEVSVEAVRSMLQRARTTLRRELDGLL